MSAGGGSRAAPAGGATATAAATAALPPSPPLTVGTAGHVDHGKTALVAALTGVDTDRLPQERERGLSIELGFASVELPGGRRLSLVDVPGHERFVRTMVAGATGVDMFLLAVAADDGVMPQTREHVAVLRALGVEAGVVAVTKSDLADPARAAGEARDLVGDGPEVVACSGRTGSGVEEVRAALARVAAILPGRAGEAGAGGAAAPAGAAAGPAGGAEAADGPLLHVDRAFTIHGAGSVVTGTLWAGTLGAGDRVAVLPAGRAARVRSVQVHDAPVERAAAGQRVAVNLAGVPLDELARGMAIADRDAGPRPAWILDAALELADVPGRGRVQVHHGTRETRARLVPLGGPFWQLRCERALLARRGDRLVVRSIARPDTLGGGTVVDPAARRHGARPDVLARLERLARGQPGPEAGTEPEGEAEPEPEAEPGRRGVGPGSGAAGGSPGRRSAGAAESGRDGPPPLSPAALELEQRLRDAAHQPPLDAELGDAADQLAALRAGGRAVRIGRAMHAHPDALAAVRDRVAALIEAEGSVTLARLRDDLGTSRKYAQALLEHCDAARLTLRLEDDSRVLR